MMLIGWIKLVFFAVKRKILGWYKYWPEYIYKKIKKIYFTVISLTYCLIYSHEYKPLNDKHEEIYGWENIKKYIRNKEQIYSRCTHCHAKFLVNTSTFYYRKTIKEADRWQDQKAH